MRIALPTAAALALLACSSVPGGWPPGGPAPQPSGCVSNGALSNGFACMPPGRLLGGTAPQTGFTGAAPPISGLRFPLKNAPAYLNSQVYRYKDGGLPPFSQNWLGPTGARLGPANSGVSQCDTRNYAYPWQDTFCERRSTGTGDPATPRCPSGRGHQGVDIRGRVCANGSPENEVVAAHAGWIIEIQPHYTKVLSTDGSYYTNYLHMHPETRAHSKAQLDAAMAQTGRGIPVARGQRLGNIGIVGANNTLTTRHLHFEIRGRVGPDASAGIEPLPPYLLLVAAYQRLLSGADN
jgi:murein DD-endopeptidase MepM/ murein hydrolase activator NlpD